MSEVFHERLKAPIPRRELDRRTEKLQQAMKQAKGVVPDAARLLQIPTSTLYQKLRMK